MSHHDRLPFGIKTVTVPGHGTYGFQSVGNTSRTTGFDVYFHPEGMPARSPGHGRMRLFITDDLGWDVEFVRTERLDEGVVRQAAEPARQWLTQEQNTLLFSLMGAAEIEKKSIDAKRWDLTLRFEGRTKWLEREGNLPADSNQPRTMTPEKVEVARRELQNFDERMGDRERALKAVLSAIREFTGRPSRRRTMDDVLAEAKDAAFPTEQTAPAP